MGGGPKTTRCIPLFWHLVSCQGAVLMTLVLIKDQTLSPVGEGSEDFCRVTIKWIWSPPPPRLPTPPPMAVYWKSIFYTTPFVLCWRRLIPPPPNLPWKPCHPPRKKSSVCYPLPPPLAIENDWCLYKNPKEKGASSIHILSGVPTVVDLRSIFLSVIIYLLTILK